MEDSDVLQRLNKILGTISVQGTYEIRVQVGSDSYRVSSSPPDKLIVAPSTDEDPVPLTKVSVDSSETLQKLGAGSQRVAMQLFAMKKLQISGDMAKLEELKREMEPHAEAFKCFQQDAAVSTKPFSGCFSILEYMMQSCLPLANVAGDICCFSIPRTNGAGLNQQAAAKVSAMPKATNHASDAQAEATKKLLYEFEIERSIFGRKVFGFAGCAMMCCGFFHSRLHSSLWSCMRIYPYTSLATVGLIMWFRGALQRSMQILWTTGAITANITLGYMQAYGRTDAASEAIWSVTHRINARTIFDATASLGGFWIKVAQGCAISPFLPDAYQIELSALQNDVPPSSREFVMRTLKDEFGPDWKTRIELSDGPPLGSATIAQVHRARIRDGPKSEFKEGVIKVQHGEISQSLYLDMYAAGALAHFMKLLNPTIFKEYPAIIREVCKMTIAELDFTTEAKNQQMASDALCKAKLPVVIPKVFGDLVARRAFAMEYVDGEKITDYVKKGSSAQQVAETICEYYAVSTLGPIFNTDPHPGNIFVEHGTGRLVALDWGQAQRQTLAEQNAMARLWVSLAFFSPAEFVEACTDFGYIFNKTGIDYSVASFVMGNLRQNSRQTKSPEETKADQQQLMDLVMAGFPQELQEVAGLASKFWTGPLLPFAKTIDILSNLAGLLNVSVSCLTICAKHSYIHLLRQRGYQIEPSLALDVLFYLPSQLSCPSASPTCSLDSELRDILRRQHSRGTILGAQLVVLDAQNGRTLCNACIGHTSWMDPEPVTSTTLFDVGEISKLVLSFIVMKLVEEKQISLDSTFAQMLPAATALKDITLEQVLAHTAGMFRGYPSSAETIADAQNLEKMLSSMVSEKPLLGAGEAQVYQHSCFGLLLTTSLSYLGRNLEQAWSDFSKSALGSSGMNSLLLHRDRAVNVAGVQPNMRTYGLEELAMDLEGMEYIWAADKTRSKPDATLLEKAEAEYTTSLLNRDTWMIDANLSLPGCQAFSTADAMAQMLLQAYRGNVVAESTLQNMTRSRKPAGDAKIRLLWQDSFTGAEFGLGVQLLGRPQTDQDSKPTAGNARAWGHSSLTGSFAFVIPGRRPLVASLALNRFGGDAVANEILACLWRHADGRRTSITSLMDGNIPEVDVERKTNKVEGNTPAVGGQALRLRENHWMDAINSVVGTCWGGIANSRRA